MDECVADVNFGFISGFDDMCMDLLALFGTQKARACLEKGGKGIMIGEKAGCMGGGIEGKSFLGSWAISEGSDDVIVERRGGVG